MLTKEILGAIAEFFWQVNRADFVEIFGERMGFHLWGKYVDLDMDAMKFVGYLDAGRFEQVVDAINASHFGDRVGEECGLKPTPENLTRIVAKHGDALFSWPLPARKWLVADPDAGDFVREHTPGLERVLADAVGRWHKLAFLSLAESDGTQEYFPF
jgi:hypothetical protein